jgi:hypothetical protein
VIAIEFGRAATFRPWNRETFDGRAEPRRRTGQSTGTLMQQIEFRIGHQGMTSAGLLETRLLLYFNLRRFDRLTG